MLLGDAHVVKAALKPLPEGRQPRAHRHGRGDGADPGVILRQLAQRLPELVGEALGLFPGVPGDHVEAGEPVVDAGVLLGVLVALSLVGAHVQEHRLVDQLGALQSLGEFL